MWTRLVRLAVMSLALGLPLAQSPPGSAAVRRPNIIIILTDDQGYGDLGRHGNPVLQTPNLDRLHDESVRFTDFHVSPTCAPTRSAILSGRHDFRNGWSGTRGTAPSPAIRLRTRMVAGVGLVRRDTRTPTRARWAAGNAATCRRTRRRTRWSTARGIGARASWARTDLCRCIAGTSTRFVASDRGRTGGKPHWWSGII